MESDRELLELAAIAIGAEYRTHKLGRDYLAWPPYWNGGPWKPLTDDGDALRLAAALKIDIEWQATHIGAEPEVEAYRTEIDGGSFCANEHENDYRRAIVRAAAEIGRRMKDADKERK